MRQYTHTLSFTSYTQTTFDERAVNEAGEFTPETFIKNAIDSIDSIPHKIQDCIREHGAQLISNSLLSEMRIA
jgi:hypothetical protein